jgi:hypothetical protein
MKMHAIRRSGLSFSISEHWADVTDALEDVNAPLTVADPVSGVGALQLSPALYRGGQSPQVMPHDLTELLDEFAAERGLDEPFERTVYRGEVTIEGASFHAGDDFIRVWYGSDGRNVVLVTYVCEWNHRDRESGEREMAIRSIRFDKECMSGEGPS